MDVTYAIAAQQNITPFALMNEDKDRVIMVINYLTEKGDKAAPAAETPKKAQSGNYDGFWDF